EPTHQKHHTHLWGNRQLRFQASVISVCVVFGLWNQLWRRPNALAAVLQIWPPAEHETIPDNHLRQRRRRPKPDLRCAERTRFLHGVENVYPTTSILMLQPLPQRWRTVLQESPVFGRQNSLRYRLE